MASLEEFRAEAVKPVVVVEEFEDDGMESLMRTDIEEALSLLSKCTNLLNYLADKDLCKAVSKRERDSMSNVSELIRGFLDDVQPHYEED